MEPCKHLTPFTGRVSSSAAPVVPVTIKTIYMFWTVICFGKIKSPPGGQRVVNVVSIWSSKQ